MNKTLSTRSYNMSRIKSKNTKPEILIRKLLHNIGYRYRIHIKNITGKPDLTFTRRKKVIFVHGCFWHRHKNCKFSTCPKTNIEFWNEKFEKNIKRDRKVQLELNPFPGVMGVAPATDEMLSTIPPRANGGNMDDPNLTKGTTVYFPVFVKGALFSIGDAHAIQGLGEVCGTAIEAPMTITYRVRVLKNKPAIKEPQYENEDILARCYSIKDVRKMLNNGKIINGITLIALQWFFLNYKLNI